LPSRRHFPGVDCRRKSPGRSASSKDSFDVAGAALLPAPVGKAEPRARRRHFDGMAPMHSVLALDSKGMAEALAPGPR